MRNRLTLDQYFEGLTQGNRTVLGRCITLIESALPEDRLLADALLHRILPFTGKSFRLGVTGSPGAGKSSFIEVFGLHVVQQGRRLAALAIDPTSQRTHGSILGDKTRMERLSVHPNAYIRPSPAGEALGGVARKTRETILLCEAAGYDFILVETVGVGQSETLAHGMVDFFLLLALAGAGDELQGVKRGVVEMADGLLITKADGDNLNRARRAQIEYQNALHLFPPLPSGQPVAVELSSAETGLGVAETYQRLLDYHKTVQQSGYFQRRRNEQALNWLHETLREQLITQFYARNKIQIEQSENEVLAGKITPTAAAAALL